MRIDEIQQQIGRGEYEVDTKVVANAILRKLMQGYGRMASAPSGDQAE